MLAVIKTGGKQYLVQEGLKLKIEKIIGKEGDNVDFNEVLLLDDKIGKPLVAGGVVKAKILRQGRGKKVIVEKFHSKVRYHKKNGHRQPFTEIEISK